MTDVANGGCSSMVERRSVAAKAAGSIPVIHPNTLRQWDKKGILPAIRIGVKRVMRYRKADILKLFNQRK